MKRARFASAPIRTSSLDWTILSGGEDAIIMGRLPNGQLARRSARLMTPPAASRAARASLSLTISGRSDGFGTLLYQSVKFPDPGSCKSHIPEMSCSAGRAVTTQQPNRMITAVATILSIESEGIKRVSRRHQYVLAAIDHVRFRGICHLTGVAMPKDLSVRRIERNQISRDVTGKKQLAGGCQ